MLKKIFAICIVAAMLLTSISALAAAPTVTTAEIIYNSSTDKYIVKGEISGNKGNIPLTLEVKLNGSTVAVAQTTAAYVPDTGVVFVFPTFMLPVTALSGTITANISGSYLASTDSSATYEYKGPDLLVAPLNAIKSAIDTLKAGTVDATTISPLVTACTTNSDVLGINDTVINALDSSSKVLWAKHMCNLEMTSFTQPYDPAQASIIKTAAIALASHYDEAVAIGQFADAKTSSSMSSWLSTNVAKYSINTDASSTDNIDEADIWTNHYNNVKANDEFLTILCKKSEVLTFDDIKLVISEGILLTEIGQCRAPVVESMVKKYKTSFDAINWSEMSQLDSEVQAQIFSQVAGTYYESYAKVAEKVNGLFPTDLSGGDTYYPTTSGGGGGFSIGSTTTSVEKPTTTSPSFKDMTEAEWAREAVESLAEKGIVSGRANGEFEPNAVITRAEFIKLIVVATEQDIPVNAETSFTDISSNAWYYKYVCAAQQAGIVTGDNYGHINPDAPITREDMAVMLFRTYGIDGKLDLPEIVFTDAEDISGYAQEAVSYFASKGIINGVGNNLFAPKRNATRAEAAKIIYQMIFK